MLDNKKKRMRRVRRSQKKKKKKRERKKRRKRRKRLKRKLWPRNLETTSFSRGGITMTRDFWTASKSMATGNGRR